MGGERASKVRQREAGKICAICSRPLDPPPWGHKTGYRVGERLCSRCERPKEVKLRYECVEGQWSVRFLDPKTRLPLGRVIRYASADKIREMVQRTPTHHNLEQRQGFEMGLTSGLGETTILLSGDQLSKIRGPK